MNASEIIQKYLGLREEKARLEAAKKEVQAQMDAIEVKLLHAFEKLGVESLRTPFGTAYATTRTSASVADKEVFMEYVREHDEWALLETRASKTGVEQFKEMHGELPPGVSWSQEVVVNVRQ
jgi:wobble nucleotide-excising tRNase